MEGSFYEVREKEILLIGFMLISLFFGAGNLIFPPFLGQNTGQQIISAMIGLLMTAVILLFSALLLWLVLMAWTGWGRM